MKRVRRVENQNGKRVYAPIKSNDDNTVSVLAPQNQFYKLADELKEKAERLKKLPYQEYLQTEHWQHIKSQALRFAGYRCMLCYSNGLLNVHHRTYDRIGEELRSDVIALCEKCHGIFHDKLPKLEVFSPEKKNGAIKAIILNEDGLPALAKYLKRAYDEFIKAGFADAQAFYIVSNYKWSQ